MVLTIKHIPLVCAIGVMCVDKSLAQNILVQTTISKAFPCVEGVGLDSIQPHASWCAHLSIFDLIATLAHTHWTALLHGLSGLAL